MRTRHIRCCAQALDQRCALFFDEQHLRRRPLIDQILTRKRCDRDAGQDNATDHPAAVEIGGMITLRLLFRCERAVNRLARHDRSASRARFIASALHDNHRCRHPQQQENTRQYCHNPTTESDERTSNGLQTWMPYHWMPRLPGVHKAIAGVRSFCQDGCLRRVARTIRCPLAAVIFPPGDWYNIRQFDNCC